MLLVEPMHKRKLIKLFRGFLNLAVWCILLLVGVGLWKTSAGRDERRMVVVRRCRAVMGTDCVLAAVVPRRERANTEEVLQRAEATIRGIEASMSTWLENSELGRLNETHMGKHGPTDVLSFPLLPPSAFPEHPGQDPAVRSTTDDFALPPGQAIHLGDIVISVERAIEQAEAGAGGQSGDVRWAAVDEMRLLITHGGLHLCGWDHAEPDEEAAMRALERELLGLGA